MLLGKQVTLPSSFFFAKFPRFMPCLVYAHGSTMYRRRFCNRYLPDLRSPPEAGRLRGGVKNPEGTGYKTFSYLKSSSNFFYASFCLFFFRVNFRSFLIYVLIVIKALSESPQTQG
jgi:hypothetical protein